MVGDQPLEKYFYYIFHLYETVEMLLPETEISPNKDWEGDILLNVIYIMSTVYCCGLNYQHISMMWYQG